MEEGNNNSKNSYKRILIKISGEGLADKKTNLSIDNRILISLAEQIKKLREQEIEIGIVIGGGNF